MQISKHSRYKLVFVVETKSKEEDSDYVYIRKVITDLYRFSEMGHKLEPIYCGGKGNITKQEKRIQRAKKQYTGTDTIVFICIDIDNPKNIASAKMNPVIYDYCKKHNYHLIWFKIDSENVFWEKTIRNSQKVSIARKFNSNGEISPELKERMRKKAEDFDIAPNRTSNFLTVFEEEIITKVFAPNKAQ